MAAIAQPRSPEPTVQVDRVLQQIRAHRKHSVIAPKPLPESVISVIERAFADHVREQLDGPVLRYSDRLKLLRAAERLRIIRFRANLIIAMVQHEAAPAAEIVNLSSVEKSSGSIGWMVTGILIAEAAVVLIACRLF